MPSANSDGCSVAKRRNIIPAAIRSPRGSSVRGISSTPSRNRSNACAPSAARSPSLDPNTL